MSSQNSRIPDNMVSEILAEAARLHEEENKGVSIADLEQACSEAKISPKNVRKAVLAIEEKRFHEQNKRQKRQAHIKHLSSKCMSVGIRFLLPAMVFSSIVIYLSQQKSPVSSLNSQKQRMLTSEHFTQLTTEIARLKTQLSVVTETQQDLDSDIKKLWVKSNYDPGAEVSRDPKVIMWEEFCHKIGGKTEEEVIQAVGKPYKTSYQETLSLWYFDNVKDSVIGSVGSATVQFKDGSVTGVIWSG